MLDIRMTVDGLPQFERSLGRMAQNVPAAASRALKRIAETVFKEAFKNLSGPGRKPVRLRTRTRSSFQDGNIERTTRGKTKARGQFDSLTARPGSWPVPVVSGNLRRKLDYVEPGMTKGTGGFSVTAGPLESAVFNAAEYARPIHDGTGSSAAYGPRPYITEPVARIDAAGIAEQELARGME